MEKHTRLMKYDGCMETILSYRVAGSIEGDSLAWRFITTGGRTVAVRPVQIRSCERPFCVPAEINSALRGAGEDVHFLIMLAHERCTVNGEPPKDEPKKRERFFREVFLYELNGFAGRMTGRKPVAADSPGPKGYTARKRAEIVKALTNPKDKGAASLEAIRSFILHQLFKDAPVVLDEARGLRGSRAMLAALRGDAPPAEGCPRLVESSGTRTFGGLCGSWGSSSART
jgi:hypothetical protein